MECDQTGCNEIATVMQGCDDPTCFENDLAYACRRHSHLVCTPISVGGWN